MSISDCEKTFLAMLKYKALSRFNPTFTPIRRKKKMKKGTTMYLVMVNDSVDSIWTEETKAHKRADKLHWPEVDAKHDHPMFSRVYTLQLNMKGKW